jgi:hypothetical protein
MLTKLHLAEDTFTLHLFLQCSQSLVDVVVANKNLHEIFPFLTEFPLEPPMRLSIMA